MTHVVTDAHNTLMRKYLKTLLNLTWIINFVIELLIVLKTLFTWLTEFK